MINEEIIAGNKLIAEFMGGVTREKCNAYIKWYIPEDEFNFDEKDYPEKPHDGSGWKFTDLKYHSLWDWLMPVVEKIESLDCNENEVTTSIYKEWGEEYQVCFIQFNDIKLGYNPGSSGVKLSKIEAVWTAVIDFIKWFNKQND